VKETEGIEALTFREAVERYPEAIRYWLHWRNETATQKWNETVSQPTISPHKDVAPILA